MPEHLNTCSLVNDPISGGSLNDIMTTTNIAPWIGTNHPINRGWTCHIWMVYGDRSPVLKRLRLDWYASVVFFLRTFPHSICSKFVLQFSGLHRMNTQTLHNIGSTFVVLTLATQQTLKRFSMLVRGILVMADYDLHVINWVVSSHV